jgi:DNA-binding transcriptional MerR regulator
MTKSPDAFRTISEVADWLGIQAHVLRFWESKFTQIKPVKRAGGRRYYRPTDMRLLGGIKALLHDDGLTIKGVQKILREQGVTHVSGMSQPLEDSAVTGSVATAEPTPTVVRLSRRSAAKPAPVIAPSPDTPPVPGTPVADAPAPPAIAGKDAPADPPVLPSFLHRPATPAVPGHEPELGPEPEPRPEPEPAPAVTPETASPMRATLIDAPDPPADNDLPYTPGALAQLAKLEQLSAAQARKIAPLADELRSWLARVTSPDAP